MGWPFLCVWEDGTNPVLAFLPVVMKERRRSMNGHLKELEERIAYEFKNKNLFTQALTHSSYANEHHVRPQVQ